MPDTSHVPPPYPSPAARERELRRSAPSTAQRGRDGEGASIPHRLTIHGRAEVAFERARLGTVYHTDPLRLLFPTPATGDPPTATVVTTSGGLVGGDRLEIAATVGEGASALVTAQAAEKVYRSTGADVRFDVALSVADGGWLEWLPQETILFDGARLRRTTCANVAGSGRLLAGELLVFGRVARGERFATGLARDAWEVRRDGRLVWADALHLDGDIPAVLDHPAGFDGATAYGTIVYVGPDAAAHLDAARDMLSEVALHAGATVLGEVLVMRLLGKDAHRLRTDFGRVWAAFRALAGGLPERLPRLWHV
ncbi:urease accessory protein UreD [Azospirillum sp.]|uniref:urease accessory protein UreD n=1 Tax=Azospirillum sp. TaxID=34012 RepID=UPI002D4F95CE|nr:urease accessory protein UreD [Azospirillum sp.]HYD67198.1 urease accessory protein UreD [Azospirillum sp.]